MTLDNNIHDAIKKAREKARTLEGVRKERIEKAIERLYDLIPEDCNPLLNDVAQKRAARIWDSTNNRSRISLNNERKGIDSKISSLCLYNQFTEMSYLLEAVDRFAENGDFLAIKIRDISDSLKTLSNDFSDEAIYKLINRSMSETEYLDFLSGDLPVITLPNGERLYVK